MERIFIKCHKLWNAAALTFWVQCSKGIAKQTNKDTMNADYCLDKQSKHNSLNLFTRCPLGSREISVLNGMGLVKPSSEAYYKGLMGINLHKKTVSQGI